MVELTAISLYASVLSSGFMMFDSTVAGEDGDVLDRPTTATTKTKDKNITPIPRYKGLDDFFLRISGTGTPPNASIMSWGGKGVLFDGTSIEPILADASSLVIF